MLSYFQRTNSQYDTNYNTGTRNSANELQTANTYPRGLYNGNFNNLRGNGLGGNALGLNSYRANNLGLNNPLMNSYNGLGGGINNYQGATGGLNRGGGGLSGLGVSSPGAGGGLNRGLTGLGISSPGAGYGVSAPGGLGGLGGGLNPIDRQYYDQQQVVLIKPPNQGSSGALGGALDGLDIDYDTYVLLLGLALAAGAFALYQIILTKGRRRSFTTQSWWEFSIDRLSDLVWTGKFQCRTMKIKSCYDFGTLLFKTYLRWVSVN